MKLSEVSGNYDKAAGYYDRATRFVFQTLLRVEDKWRGRTVELLGDVAGKRVLDIGCGTGRNFPFLAPAVGNAGEIVALDYSKGMLAEARSYREREGWSHIRLVRGDAAVLDTGDEEPFDAAIAVWCLGIVHDLDAALERMLSRVKPGGRVAIMDFQAARPDRGLMRWLYPLYSRLLQSAGIDTAEDLDDQALRERWRKGQAMLRSRLTDVHEETYLQGLGFVLAGTVKH